MSRTVVTRFEFETGSETCRATRRKSSSNRAGSYCASQCPSAPAGLDVHDAGPSGNTTTATTAGRCFACLCFGQQGCRWLRLSGSVRPGVVAVGCSSSLLRATMRLRGASRGQTMSASGVAAGPCDGIRTGSGGNRIGSRCSGRTDPLSSLVSFGHYPCHF